ncbi:MAG: hypothetical protein M1831_005400 [Alyxoria varia]|nr:MAG: hypothetical protein M1831_005400 [Alyxoria varia]
MSQSQPQPQRPPPPTHRASLANPPSSTSSSHHASRSSATAPTPTQRPASVANPSTSNTSSTSKNSAAVSAAQSRMVRIAKTALVADKGVVALPPPPAHGPRGELSEGEEVKEGEDEEEKEERLRVVLGEGVIVHPFGRVDATGLGASPSGAESAGRKRKRKAPRIELDEGCVVWEKACVGGAFPGSAPAPPRHTRRDRGKEDTEEEGKEEQEEERPGIHLSKNVTVHPHATIYSHFSGGSGGEKGKAEPNIPTTTIGPHTIIHHSAILAPNVHLGSHVRVTAAVFIPPGTVIRDNAVVTPDGAGAQNVVRVRMGLPVVMGAGMGLRVRYPRDAEGSEMDRGLEGTRRMEESKEGRERELCGRLVKGVRGGGGRFV